MDPVLSSNPIFPGNYLSLGGDAGAEGAGTRTANTAKRAHISFPIYSSASAQFVFAGMDDDGTDRIGWLGGINSGTAIDELRVYLAASYGGDAVLAMLLTTNALTLNNWNYAGAGSWATIKTQDKIGTNLGGDGFRFQAGAPTGTGDGGAFEFYTHRDGGSSGSDSQTARNYATFKADKNGYLEMRPGTADKVVVVNGTLKSLPNEAATNSGTSVTDLASVTLTAGLLKNKGDAIRLSARIAFAANANNKRTTIVLGSTTLVDTGDLAASGGGLHITCTIYRSASSIIQSWDAAIVGHPTLVTDAAPGGTAAENTGNSLVLKITGQGGASSDLTLTNVLWEFLAANTANASL